MEKKYLIDNKELMKEWNWEKNENLDPRLLTCGSGKKVWWICNYGHQWETSILSRKKGNCPYCSGRRVLVGFNDLKTLFPEIAKEWNYEKNFPKIPENFTKGSGHKAWWKCNNCGHEWQSEIGSRTLGRGCPICSLILNKEMLKNRHLKNGNNLAEIYPELLKEWDYEKNFGISPYEVPPHSNKYVWWEGVCGHTWKTKINHRANGSGCPYCANQKLLVGFNDLYTKNKKVAKEWDKEKNDKLTPDCVIYTSTKKVWWKCNKNHTYQMKISDKYSGWNCPYCTHKKLLKDFNDLLTLNPRVASEWNYEKNGNLTPSDVIVGIKKKVWWKCKKGHEWYASISSRNTGTGCPQCNKENHSSTKEMIVYYYIKKYFKDSISSYRPTYLKGKEIDIYIPSLNVGIEYDGQFHHKNVERDLQKNTMLFGKIKFIRIREPNCPILSDGKSHNIILNDLSNKSLESVIGLLLLELRITNFDINIAKDLSEIYKQIDYKERENSFGHNHPELLNEWDNNKNGNLTPFTVDKNSSKIINWKCKNGHTWQARVYTRNKGIGCPYCSGRYATKENNLSVVNPEICKYWDYDKNLKKPDEYTPVSGQKVWWKCSKCGYEWSARISDQIRVKYCIICNKENNKKKGEKNERITEK